MTSPDDAQRALEEVAGSRRTIAERVSTPWWYRLGSATCTAGLFVGAGLSTAPGTPGDEPSSLGTALTVALAVVGPLALLAALKRATGVSVDRYASGLGTWYAVVFSLFGVALTVQVATGVAYVLPAAGVLAFVATLVTEQRIDVRLRERVASGTSTA